MIDKIRFFDIVLSLLFLVILSPLFLIIFILVKCDTKGRAIFRQERVGFKNKNFMLYKFRSMRENTQGKSSLTLGDQDDRITSSGKFLRKWKLDELPQLWNVLKGDMSMVGPRPELRKYVNYYTLSEMDILNIKPGITDMASLKYRDESAILGAQTDPEIYYIKEILPAKIKLNKIYFEKKNLSNYFRILFNTILSIIKA